MFHKQSSSEDLNLEFLPITFFISFIVSGLLWKAMREQRWFKKILFYKFPKYLRPISYQHRFINLYYNRLTNEERKKFEWRAYYFLDTTDITFKNFSPTDIVNINSVRYLIASVATQMTLFLPEDCFDAFHKMIIVPDKYYSKQTGRFHFGETNPGKGVIILAYSNLTRGFEQAKDGVNLLMHELAHAIWLEHHHLGYQIFDDLHLEKYKQLAYKEMMLAENETHHFFRKYAFANEEEFFAVATENFFERPSDFKLAQPELYQAMVNLFNQDTLHLQTKL